jgi:co-chaperonin GroES (HSP10)
MQTPHETTNFWPVPMGQGVLVEIQFERVETKLTLLGGNMRNLPVATVRAVSPFLPAAIRARLMPHGEAPGYTGAEVLLSEANLRYLREEEYEACGLTYPSEENGLGDLAEIAYDKIIAILPEDDMPNNTLPWQPLGSRVFFVFDFDDQSTNEITLDSGIIVQERSLAVTNQMATVIGVGPACKYVREGDRVIAPMQAASVAYGGQTWYFVTSETEIVSVLRRDGEGLTRALPRWKRWLKAFVDYLVLRTPG